MKKVLIILHRKNGDTGKIGTILKDWGYQLDIRCAIEGDELPNPKEYAAIIVLGGIMSANDCLKIPGIQKEIDWIPSVLVARIPYLGICLGAQLLAKALGAGVSKKLDNSVEIGFHMIKPTNQDCKIFPPEGMRFYQWHLEEFSIPDNCIRLAENENFSNQAFKYNDRTIGLQFHPEATGKMIDLWVEREPENLGLKGAQSYKTQIELFEASDKATTEWLKSFLIRWLKIKKTSAFH